MTNDVYAKSDIAYSAEINGRTVVLNMETRRFYHLDGVGCLIWQLLETPSTVNEVAEGISDKCEVPAAECLDDVSSFINSLCSNNLITKITEV